MANVVIPKREVALMADLRSQKLASKSFGHNQMHFEGPVIVLKRALCSEIGWKAIQYVGKIVTTTSEGEVILKSPPPKTLAVQMSGEVAEKVLSYAKMLKMSQAELLKDAVDCYTLMLDLVTDKGEVKYQLTDRGLPAMKEFLKISKRRKLKHGTVTEHLFGVKGGV